VYRANYNKRAKKPKYFFQDVIYRDLLVDLFVTPSICTVVIALKIAGHVLGTDVAITVIFSIMVVIFNLVTKDTSREEFRILLRASMTAPQTERRLRNLHIRLQHLGTFVYCAGVIVPTLYALSLDKSRGPMENGEYIIVILRNIMALVWTLTEVICAHLVRNQVKSVLSGSVGSMKCSTTDVVKRLDDEIKQLRNMFTFAFVMYAVFTIPWLWPFQTYPIALFSASAVMRSTASHLNHLTAKGSTSDAPSAASNVKVVQAVVASAHSSSNTPSRAKNESATT
jgi:hypothetical protein